MELKKRPLSIKIIYWLTQITFWLVVLVLVGALAMNVAIQAEWLGDNMQLHTVLPVQVNYTEKGTLNIDQTIQEVEFVEAIGKLHFINTSEDIAKWFGVFLIVAIIFLLYIFLMFKNFVSNVYRGIVFERYNIRMLQKISYGLVGMWLFLNIYSWLFYYFIAKRIEFEYLEITGEVDSYGGILLAALLLWVLSYIFMRGVKLREEQELTV